MAPAKESGQSVIIVAQLKRNGLNGDGAIDGSNKMQRIKIFKSVESELSTFEQDINDWLEESGAKLISVTGNIAPQTPENSDLGGAGTFSASDILIIVVYEV